MRQILLDLYVADPSGEYKPAVGDLVWRPTARVSIPDGVVLPRAFSVALGSDAVPIRVAPTGPHWCWQVREHTARGEDVRYLVVPEGEGVLRYSELQEVDPKTLDPVAEPEAAWWLALQDIDMGGGGAPTEHTHEIEDVQGLTDALAGKAEADHAHPEYENPAPPDLSNLVSNDDPRLSDARPPVPHSHEEYLTADDLPEIPEPPDLSGYVQDDDPRLVTPERDALLQDVSLSTPSAEPDTIVRRDELNYIHAFRVTSSGEPTSDDHLTRKSYVDSALAGKQDAGNYAAANHHHDGAYRPADWAPGVADLPSGSVLTVVAPATARPTTRTDVTVLWVNHGERPGAAMVGDIWLQPAPEA